MRLYQDKNWLYQKYWIEKKSIKKIVEECDCCASNIIYWMKKLGVKRLSRLDARERHFTRKKIPKDTYLNKKWLYTQYWSGNKSFRRIAEECGCGKTLIEKQMKIFNIPSRTRSEAGKVKIISEGTRKKLSESMKKRFLVPNSKDYLIGAKFSEERKRKISESRRGEKNWMWKGGDYPCYYGPNWAWQRKKALKRDKHTCQECGQKKHDVNGRMVAVHHIMARRKYLDMMLDCYVFHEPHHIGILKVVPFEVIIPNIIWYEANRLDNLVTLCDNPCHKKWENEAVLMERK